MNSNGYSSQNGFANGVNSNANSNADSSRNFYDEEKDDPTQVDGLLSEELMQSSVKDRTDFQEEIHGV